MPKEKKPDDAWQIKGVTSEGRPFYFSLDVKGVNFQDATGQRLQRIRSILESPIPKPVRESPRH